MGKLIILDHAYHKKTHSSDFLAEDWRKAGWEVITFYDDEWNGGTGVSLDDLKRVAPDLLFSFQILKSVQYYRSTGCPKIVLIPMYDSCAGDHIWDWWEYREFYFLHFSKTLFLRLKRLGFCGHYIQYFPPLPETATLDQIHDRPIDFFFWYRRDIASPDLIVRFVIKIIGRERIIIHFHNALDPGQSMPSINVNPDDLVVTNWFKEKSDYQHVVANSKIYLAPRLKEGIGLSFLEAMAHGCVVVAHNAPTMNEYLKHGKNGLLVNIKNPKNVKVRHLDLQAMSTRARKSIVEGRAQYLSETRDWISNSINYLAEMRRFTFWAALAAILFWSRHSVVRPVKKLFKQRGKL